MTDHYQILAAAASPPWESSSQCFHVMNHGGFCLEHYNNHTYGFHPFVSLFQMIQQYHYLAQDSARRWEGNVDAC